jgi:dTDP-L-rhamnose 4-epimerase
VVVAAEQPVAGEAINIGSGEALSVRDIAESLALALDKDIAPQIVGKYRRGDIRHCFADISKARRLLQWQPQRVFHRGVTELVSWVQAQCDTRDSVGSAWNELQRQGLLL